MKKTKVTVITAVCNLIKEKREKLFRQCVESVYDQTYSNVEHIVIYTPGDDNTLELVKEYENKGWLKSITENERGIYKAFNLGIEKAQGEYILFLNSDDSFCEPKAIEWSVKKLEETNADFSIADGIMLKDGKYDWMFTDNSHAFLCKMPFSHQTMFIKKDVLQDFGNFDTKYKLAADYDLIVRLFLSNKKYCYVPKAIVNCDQDGLTFQRFEESKQEQAKVYCDLYKEFYKFSDFKQAQGLILGRSVPHDFCKAFKKFVKKKRLDNLDYSRVYKYLSDPDDFSNQSLNKYTLLRRIKKTRTVIKISLNSIL